MTDSEKALQQMRIINRMRRKIDIIRLDAKAKQDPAQHDMSELLSLLDMLERALSKGE
jgi:hypothetical protein